MITVLCSTYILQCATEENRPAGIIKSQMNSENRHDMKKKPSVNGHESQNSGRLSYNSSTLGCRGVRSVKVRVICDERMNDVRRAIIPHPVIETVCDGSRLSGEPQGNTSSTSKRTIVERTVVDNKETDDGRHAESSSLVNVRKNDVRSLSIVSPVCETICEGLRLSGEPHGNTSTTSQSMIVDQAVVDNNATRSIRHEGVSTNYDKVPRVQASYDENDVRSIILQTDTGFLTHEEIAKKTSPVKEKLSKGVHLPEVENPRNTLEFNTLRGLSEVEDEAIRIAEGMKRPEKSIREGNRFNLLLKRVNKIRVDNGLSAIDVEYKNTSHRSRPETDLPYIVPCFYLVCPKSELEGNSISDRNVSNARYQDEIIAAQVEVDAINFITNKKKSSMLENNQVLFEKYLSIVNDRRTEDDDDDGFPLILDDTVEEHYRKLKSKYGSPSKKRRYTSDGKSDDDTDDSMLTSSCDDDDSSDSDSSIESNEDDMESGNDVDHSQPSISRCESTVVQNTFQQEPVCSDRLELGIHLGSDFISSMSTSRTAFFSWDKVVATDENSKLSCMPNRNSASASIIDLTESSIQSPTPSVQCDNDAVLGKNVEPPRTMKRNSVSVILPERACTEKAADVTVTPLLPKEKRLKNFINELLDIGTCPITCKIFRKPVRTGNGIVFENSEIRQWLDDGKSECPFTRESLSVDHLTDDKTMEKLVLSIKNHDITPTFFDDLLTEFTNFSDMRSLIKQGDSHENKGSVSNTPNLCLPTDLPPNILRKKRRQKENRVFKKKLNLIMKEHKDVLIGYGYFKKANFHQDMPLRPSYSLLHSFSEGFSIVLYSRSHRVVQPNLKFHRNNGIRLILPSHMCLIVHEKLFYSMTKSRSIPDALNSPFNHSVVLTDLIFFAEICPYSTETDFEFSLGKKKGRSLRSNMCSSWSDCQHCKKDVQNLDLRVIDNNSYQPGERIIGDLDESGWVVVRSGRVSEDTDNAIKSVGNVDNSWSCNWHEHESNTNRRKIYVGSNYGRNDWSTAPLKEFLVDVKRSVLKKSLDDDNANLKYGIRSINLIKNIGVVCNDDIPESDWERNKCGKGLVIDGRRA